MTLSSGRYINRKRVLILGSGFAGTYAYLEFLKRARNRTDLEVVLVSDQDHFLFIPLLHEVATGNLPPNSISQPIMSLPQERLDDYVRARVLEINLDSQSVCIEVKNGAGTITDTLSYDYLIIALGSETAYYNVPGAPEYALALKNMEHARAIKNHVLDVFEQAQCPEEERKQELLTFVIVGGGPTGVEMAGELSDFIRHEMAAVYPDLARGARILLTDGGDRLLKGLDTWFAEEVREILDRKGVSVCLGSAVSEVRPGGVVIGDSFIAARTVIWAAGVKANDVDMKHHHEILKDERSHRIHVSRNLNLSAYENVFVAGDQAYVIDTETEAPYTMRAQFAVRQGIVSARNILAHLDGKPLKDFQWQDKGIILSLGDKGALAKIMGIRFSGFLAWVLYRGAYLSKMYGWRTKARTSIEWLLNLWAPRDISKI